MAQATKPFFVSQNEIDYIDKVNEELIDEIVGQTVDIYKITVDNTEENIYGESSTKYFDTGFRVNCLILFNPPVAEMMDDIGTDINTSIELYFHRKSLKDSNFFPEIGDIVDWNDFYWEINGVTEPQLIAGHHNFRHSITATAHRIRRSALQIEERPK